MIRASDQVREQVEREIGSGALRPGDTIDERSLSVRFEVSRTPAREAILQLAAAGLVRMSPRRGAVVAGASADEAIAMMETLAALEAEAASLAARRMPEDERRALKAVHLGSRPAALEQDSKAYIDANAGFHECVYAGARNAYLSDLIRQTRLRMAFYHTSSLYQRARVTRSWDEHGVVVAAILAGEPDAAGAAMRDHILSGGRVYADLVAALGRDDRRREEAAAAG